MVLDHTRDGCFYFKYEHNKDYRQVQFKFWEAVGSMNPGNIVVSDILTISIDVYVYNG